MTALTDKSLPELEPESLGQTRYRLLESVREYAAGCLTVRAKQRDFERRRRDYAVREPRGWSPSAWRSRPVRGRRG